MKNSHPRPIDHSIDNDTDLVSRNKDFKTTNINILLNRVKIEKKIRSRKKIIFSMFIISIITALSIIVFSN